MNVGAGQQEMQRFVQVSRQTKPPGGGPLGSIGGLAGLGAQIPSISYEGRHITNNHDDDTPVVNEGNLNLSIPVYKRGLNTLALTMKGGTLNLGEKVRLDSGDFVDTTFYRSETGIQYSRKLENRRMFGLRGSVGYTGDKLNSETQSFNISANYSYPGSDNNQWVLMLMMSNNSPLGAFVPIPGFFYITRTDTFTGIFGFPILSMQWTPVNPWAFSLSFFGPMIRSEVAYGAIDEVQFFTALGWKQQRYIVSERKEEDDRLTFEEKYSEVGIRKPIYKRASVEGQIGYSYDRSVYVGEGLFNKDRGEADIDSNWYAKWTIKMAF